MLITKAVLGASVFSSALGASICKNHPLDLDWPNADDWSSLNQSTNGALIRSSPAASSCYGDNPFGSKIACNVVQERWFSSAFHATQPETILYNYWANNSCVPPNDDGFEEGQQCNLGGMPEYVLNATNPEQIATAARWASSRNIRVIVKGTGHDLVGRSSGAYSLSIWTHHLRKIELDAQWQHPLQNKTENAIILGSGNVWGDILQAAATTGRTVISGQEKTVGMGGFIGGGGLGPLSSHYGTAADQVLQATVVTTEGQILVANEAQNQDLFWAIRGGGPGLYGIVTEYVLRTLPVPQNVVKTRFTTSPVPGSVDAVEASWDVLALILNSLPDLMDLGISGHGQATIMALPGNLANTTKRAVEVSLILYGFNTTEAALLSVLRPFQDRVLAGGRNGSVSANLSEPQLFSSYGSFFDDMNSVPSPGGAISLISSRLLGRRELTDISLDALKSHLEDVTKPQAEGDASILIFGLQGGPGTRNVEASRRGAVTPAWRKAYLHLLSTGAIVDHENLTPQAALADAANWTEENREKVWRQWAPDSGSYINEANPYNGNFQYDFYGGNYDRLLEIKQKYDPTESLYVLSGVGSHKWEYSLDSGKLCQKQPE